MVEDDAAYFERRAAEELLAAERATTPQAERAHRELHARFQLMADEGVGPTVIPLSGAQA